MRIALPGERGEFLITGAPVAEEEEEEEEEEMHRDVNFYVTCDSTMIGTRYGRDLENDNKSVSFEIELRNFPPLLRRRSCPTFEINSTGRWIKIDQGYDFFS